MRKTVTSLTTFAALAALLSAPATAADLDNIVYAPELPVTQPVEIGSGWYIRGDLGYSATENGDVDTFRTYSGGTYTNTSFDSARLGTDFSGSLGVGYQFNEWIRADTTLEIFKGDFGGSYSAATPCSTGATFVGTTCLTTYGNDFTAYSSMVNAYIDLGTYARFTPYIGGGAGMTLINHDTTTAGPSCVNGAATCPATPLASTSHEGESSWRFTWALAAGLAYDVTPNMKIDLGYRYSKITGGPLYNFSAANQALGAAGAQADDNGLGRHEVRLGLRYEIW